MGTSPRPALDVDKFDDQIVVNLSKRRRYTASKASQDCSRMTGKHKLRFECPRLELNLDDAKPEVGQGAVKLTRNALTVEVGTSL